MLNSLVIKNFRMLEDFTVEKLGRVNLIVGKNNSGKSTVLEALRIYAGNANQELLEKIAESHNEELSTKNEYKLFFYEELFTGRKWNVIDNNKVIKIGERDNEIKQYIIGLVVINFAKNTVKMIKHGEKNTDACSFIPTHFISIDELADEWDSIAYTENEKIVLDALKIIIPEFDHLIFVKNERLTSIRIAKVKLANLPKPVPLKSLGDGMLRILQIAIKLVSAQGGFLLIDEFENGLHYSTQEKIWALLFEMAEKLNIQVFATTHSWDCIESFTKVAIENETTEGVLFRMGRSAKTSNKGQVIATVYDKERLYNITQADIEVR
jgi:AAA15 family ATPase/GTPase